MESALVGEVPRFSKAALLTALADTPVVLLHGPRQCGKTTLARTLENSHGYQYLTFDDDNLRIAAATDPVGFVATFEGNVILDEVQRVPELFASLKLAVDKDRRSGQFLLTGSTNILLLPKLADSLAGRMEVQRLFPLAQCELAKTPCGFLDALFTGEFSNRRYTRLGPQLAEHVVAGGYPAALARVGARRRQWYRAYIETLVQRDIRELARISSLDILPRLIELAAGQTARLFNVSELASPFQLSRPTIRDYLSLLEQIFLLEQLPPWHSNRISRLIKTPKLHLVDTGLASALLRVDAAALNQDRALLGQLLETFVYQELRRLASWHVAEISFSHFRDKDGFEVDIVMEHRSRQIVGIEVKASATITLADFRGLRKLRDVAGSKFQVGAVLYDGESVLRFGEGLFAVPISALWHPTPGRRKVVVDKIPSRRAKS
jgi:uncharacterized protein